VARSTSGLKKGVKIKNGFFICSNLIVFKHNMQAKSIIGILADYHGGMKIGRPAKSQRSAFGVRLQFLREQANLNQREVAAALGISQPSYAKCERRDIGLTRERLQKLSGILGVEVEDFFSADDHPKRNGPVGRARKTFETLSQLPRSRQKQILDVVDVLLRKDLQPQAA
jgi:transcriptional regulator with XRE-family HTH domain